ncbi:MAG: hypothetical protein HQL01_10875 [Nitrospirae bacterium]|nr:hypothetical protein [Nitrospirota bacterium]
MLIVQGDVFLTKAVRIPRGAKQVAKGKRGYTLAEGETTGHAHVIEDDGVELYESNGVLYVKTGKSVKLRHEEHKEVTINEGVWKVGQVQEFDAFDMEVRSVKD